MGTKNQAKVQKTRHKIRNKILWITDPWETLDHRRDTTLRLMEEAQLAGLTQWWCSVRSIRLEGSQVVFDAKKVLSVDPERSLKSFRFEPVQVSAPKNFTSIHYRTDPPVDLSYLQPLQLLEFGLRGCRSTELINPASVLFQLNEKFEATALGKVMPPSLVSSQWEHLLHFGQKEHRTVLKPLHEAQSHGIELLDWTTPTGVSQAKAKIQTLSSQFSTPVLLQRYLEEIDEGETRLWFLDGRLLATVKKLPIPGDFRVDIDQGSLLAPTQLHPKQRRWVAPIAKHLKSHKIRLAAVDLIGDRLTDFNFTSPGLITLMEKTLQRNLAREIIHKLYAPK
jgi:glutathione synthase